MGELLQLQETSVNFAEIENYFQGGNAASIRGTFPDSAILSEIFVL
jgi:hypothetical protein